MGIKIYHNNRCSKSNAALKALENSGANFTIINYLESPPSLQELKVILKMLGITPIELMRSGEAIFKEKIKGKNLTDEQLLSAMLENPILIQRPIIINGDKAVIARNEEAIESII